MKFWASIEQNMLCLHISRTFILFRWKSNQKSNWIHWLGQRRIHLEVQNINEFTYILGISTNRMPNKRSIFLLTHNNNNSFSTWLEYTYKLLCCLFHANFPVLMAESHSKEQTNRRSSSPHSKSHYLTDIPSLLCLPVKGHDLSFHLYTDPDLAIPKVFCFYGCSWPSCQHWEFCFHFLAINKYTSCKKHNIISII